MKRFLILFLSVILLASCATARHARELSPTQEELVEDSIKVVDNFAPDRLLIKYDESVGKEPLLKAINEYKAEIIYDYSIIPWMAIKIPEGSDIKKAINYFKQVTGVVTVERDRIYRLTDPVRPKIEVM